MMKCPVCKIVTLLAGLGALNWLLVAVANMNIVASLFGTAVLAKTVYICIGAAGIILLLTLIKPCPCACLNKKS